MYTQENIQHHESHNTFVKIRQGWRYFCHYTNLINRKHTRMLNAHQQPNCSLLEVSSNKRDPL